MCSDQMLFCTSGLGLWSTVKLEGTHESLPCGSLLTNSQLGKCDFHTAGHRGERQRDDEQETDRMCGQKQVVKNSIFQQKGTNKKAFTSFSDSFSKRSVATCPRSWEIIRCACSSPGAARHVPTEQSIYIFTRSVTWCGRNITTMAMLSKQVFFWLLCWSVSYISLKASKNAQIGRMKGANQKDHEEEKSVSKQLN